MTILAVNLDEVSQFINETTSIRDKIKNNKDFREGVLNQEQEYEVVKNHFIKFVSFLKYTQIINIENCYRVRKKDNDTPFNKRVDVIYPEPNQSHQDRMNNTSFRVLYTSLNEFTAMAETRLNESYIDKFFQLTRFKVERELKVFRLGLFSELYLNSPRDSEFVKSQMKRLLGSENHDSALRGFAALECAIADILYDQGEDYHILSSIMADAIFSEIEEVEAILYPSLQNRYGLNLAIKKEVSDSLEISFTCLNKLVKVYENGFYKYHTLAKCTEFNDDKNFSFVDIREPDVNKILR
ncbi:TPA: RES domain-containing protein [Vibrio vulnificus]|nr:RES domain-containing protein [Vibrio vulnificus]